MGRISLEWNEKYKRKIEVEHFVSQELKPELSLVYNNLLGVCNGLSNYPSEETMHHCDKTKGDEGKGNGKIQLKKLDPRSKNCEKLVKYDLTGSIIAINDDTLVNDDLNKVLNLNNKALKAARKIAIDNALKKMRVEKPTQQWNKAFIQKHQEEWLSMKKGHFLSYCMTVVWFLQELMNKPQYNR